MGMARAAHAVPDSETPFCVTTAWWLLCRGWEGSEVLTGQLSAVSGNMRVWPDSSAITLTVDAVEVREVVGQDSDRDGDGGSGSGSGSGGGGGRPRDRAANRRRGRGVGGDEEGAEASMSALVLSSQVSPRPRSSCHLPFLSCCK